MGLRIHTNVPSLMGQRHLRISRGHLDRAMERLSSGFRINRAADDAAGLANSEMMRSQLRAITQAQRNAQDGISVVQIIEGSLSEISNILVRMREISMQAASDTVGPTERSFLNIEFSQLLAEVDRISHSTEYNHVKLLDGSTQNFRVQVGAGNSQQLDQINLFHETAQDVSALSLGIHLLEVSQKVSAQNALGAIDSALEKLNHIRAHFGAVQNRLQATINNISVQKENLSAAMSRIKDADMAEEMSELTKQQILMQSGVSVLSQANTSVKSALSLLMNGAN